MKIVVVGNYRPDEQRSMLRYSDELAANLSQLGINVTLIRPPEVANKFVARSLRLAKFAGYFDKFLLFPLILFARMLRADIVHIADHSNGLYRFFVWGRPVMITCHDTFAIRIMLGQVAGQSFGRFGRCLQRANLAGLKHMSWISCVSSETANDLARLIGPNRQIGIIANALAPVFCPAVKGEKTIENDEIPGAAPVILHVGGNGYYKNRLGVVALFEYLAAMPAFVTHRLVLAGKPPDDRLENALSVSMVKDRIDVVINPNDKSLLGLYRSAELLLFPSLQEGFGWPILEAQACGCLVVTTNKEPMRTIAGGAAILIDPAKPIDAAIFIAEKIVERSQMIRAGFLNAAAYAPEVIFPRYLAVYRILLGSPQDTIVVNEE